MSEYITSSIWEEPGFAVLVRFGAWRVAQLAQCEGMTPGSLARMERHMDTDEVFVLQRGRAVLIVGQDGDAPGGLVVVPMKPDVVYNVRRAVWHQVALWPDALTLIVENEDTGAENSQYAALSAAQLGEIDALWLAQGLEPR